jgi:hypothetical protein
MLRSKSNTTRQLFARCTYIYLQSLAKAFLTKTALILLYESTHKNRDAQDIRPFFIPFGIRPETGY